MKLTLEGIANQGEWEQKGYQLPQFDIAQIKRNTMENPKWIHFGAGNIFRAFQANVVQQLLNEKVLDTGLIVAEGYDYEILEKMNRPHDELGILATLKADGTIEKTVIASVVESVKVDSKEAKEFQRLQEIFQKKSLQMVSFTITEKGYSLVDGKGDYLVEVENDFTNEPSKAVSYIGKVCALLYTRYQAGELPIAMVSMDNCSHNGDKLKSAVIGIATKWVENQKAEQEFLAYLNNGKKVSFPWTMIDKITPRPDESVQQILEADGIEELEAVVTSKNTYVAPFVNAEECEYLIIEDDFPNGKVPLEQGGIQYVERSVVDKVEKMKVCTCLNPLHTALAVYGCLLDYQLISEEMKNPLLKKLVEEIGYTEGLPVVVHPGILDPKVFIDEVLTKRIPNPFMPDSPQRIATDTSQKVGIRFGETIKNYMEREDLEASELTFIPLAIAGWLRYLLGVDDAGNSFELSSDPLLEELTAILGTVTLGGDYNQEALQILGKESIFGVNLETCGLQNKIHDMFQEMIVGPKAIENTLAKYLG